MKFTHLNLHQRYQIEQMLGNGKSIVQIALYIGVHRSTVYRELKRCSHLAGEIKHYDFESAQQHADALQAHSSGNQVRKSQALWVLVDKLLKQEWSPQSISERLQLTACPFQVSHQGIYNYLKRSKSALREHLRHHARKESLWRHRRVSKTSRPSIWQRPPEVEHRLELGHYEGDSIVGKERTDCIVTLVERASLYVRISQVLPKDAKEVAKSVKDLLRNLPQKTLTLDNGCEFMRYKDMGLPVYFADPGQPRQRARNENINGLIRQYIPKGQSLKNVSVKKIKEIEDRLNHRPRKTLGYRTPYEVLFSLPPAPVAIEG